MPKTSKTVRDYFSQANSTETVPVYRMRRPRLIEIKRQSDHNDAVIHAIQSMDIDPPILGNFRFEIEDEWGGKLTVMYDGSQPLHQLHKQSLIRQAIGTNETIIGRSADQITVAIHRYLVNALVEAFRDVTNEVIADALLVIWNEANVPRADLDKIRKFVDLRSQYRTNRKSRTPVDRGGRPNGKSAPPSEAEKAKVEIESLSPAKKVQVDFWTFFRDYTLSRTTEIRATKPLPQHWMNMSIGRSGFNLCAVASFWNNETNSYDSGEIRAEVVIYHANAKESFRALLEQKEAIENELGYSLDWHSPDEANACKIYARKSVDLAKRSDWENQAGWLLSKLEELRAVFGPRIRSLTI